MKPSLFTLLALALERRISALNLETNVVLRLFNGYIEGFPSLTVDKFHNTLVVKEGKRNPQIPESTLDRVVSFYLSSIPEVQCVVNKKRHSLDPAMRRGKIIHGSEPSSTVSENGIQYAIDLMIQQDESLYIDNRNLRSWLRANAKDWNVLNTFAYTGSLGIAALAGGAAHVYQTDRNPAYLRLAQRSLSLNNLDPTRQHCEAYDFFKVTSKLRMSDRKFDAVILDPPFFASAPSGRIDLQTSIIRLINKVRPLVNHKGCLVVINNSLFLSGRDFLDQTQELIRSEYLQIREIIPVAEDCAGFGKVPAVLYPTDPSPFNHPTKIIVFDALRKQS